MRIEFEKIPIIFRIQSWKVNLSRVKSRLRLELKREREKKKTPHSTKPNIKCSHIKKKEREKKISAIPRITKR